MPLARANRGSLRIAMLRRRCRAPQESADQAEAFLAMRTAPVLDDLPITHAKDGGAVDLDRVTRRRNVEEGGAGMRALDTPIGDDEVTGLDDKVDREGHVRERRSCPAPPLLPRAAAAAPAAVRAHPTRHVTLEVLGPEAIDRVGVTGLHRCAVLGEGPQVFRHSAPFLLVSD